MRNRFLFALASFWLLLITFAFANGQFPENADKGTPVHSSSEFQLPALDVQAIESETVDGPTPGFSMALPEVGIKEAEKEWKLKMKDLGGKVDYSRGEISAELESLQGISNAPLTVFSVFKLVESQVTLHSFFKSPSGGYLKADADPQVTANIERFMKDFGLTLVRKGVEKELESAQRNKKKIGTNLSRLDREMFKLQDEIDELRGRLDEAQGKFDEFKEEQTSDQDALAHQDELIDAIKAKLRKFE